MPKAFVSWSGGKESSLACYKAKLKGLDVSYLLNFINLRGRSMPHQIRSGLIRAQCEAIGIPLIQKRTSSKTYEQTFKNAMVQLEHLGVGIGVFGDVDIELHKHWIEEACGKDVKPIWPLWGQEREKILNEFISGGFVAVVVATKANLLGEEWVGRKIDKGFVEDLKKHPDVDLCGESGEYHSFVSDGPIFRKRIKILESSKKLKSYDVVGKREWRWLLDISSYEVCSK
jgi:diphthine-ammonia ligase